MLSDTTGRSLDPAFEPTPSAFRVRTRLIFAAIVLYGALLSIGVQGFTAGIGNNVFHFPIMGKLYDLPQFASDRYIQSLRNYASLFWVAASSLGLPEAIASTGHALDRGRIELLFLFFHLCSRLLSFAALLLCAKLLGVSVTKHRVVLATLLAATPLLQGYSPAGHGGLFIDYFTHSELCNGLAMMCIYFALRGRFIAAWALNGVAFSITPFMGAWIGIVLAVLLLMSIGKEVPIARAAAKALAAFGAFAVVAGPEIWLLAHSSAASPVSTFDYAAYLRFYYPEHFLFSFISLKPKLLLATIAALGYLALRQLKERSRLWNAALSGAVAIYLAGIALPHLTTSKLLLNLHLLREGALIQSISGLTVLTLATRWLFSERPLWACVFGPALVLVCGWPNDGLLLAAGIVVVSEVTAGNGALGRPLTPLVLRRIRVAMLSGAAILAIVSFVGWHLGSARKREALDAWWSIGAWIRGNTPESSIFLLPLEVQPASSWRPMVDVENDPVTTSFEAVSLRRGWVDFKRGAAVMWSSSFYDLWMARIGAAKDLKTLQQKKAFAAENGIQYVIDKCSANDGPDARRGQAPLFRNNRFCVYGVP